MQRSSPRKIEEEIRRLEEAVGRLSPVQKMLLGTDGSVTTLLEVVTGNPVEIETLVQKVVGADEKTARELEIAPGEEVNYRVVKLKSSVSKETLIHASSFAPLKRLEDRFRSDLMRADVPIGTILKKHRIESRRDLLRVRAAKEAGEMKGIFNLFSNEPMLSRDYKIIRHGTPLMAITETFPFNNFRDESRVIVQTPSRIHITLTDLAGDLGRVDGGVGVALDEPSILVEAEKSEGLTIIGQNADRARAAAAAAMDRFELGGAKITVRSSYRQHVGLGGGTQLAMAVGKALCELYGQSPSSREIAAAVGRGGTSGIGVAAFERGGFIVDGGHSFGPGKEKTDFRPSSASSGVAPPPVIMRAEIPREWRFVLAMPNLPKGAHGRKEVDVFGTFCPVPKVEVAELCRLIMVGMMPSVMEGDLESFGKALNRVQELGFKKVEVGLQHPLVRGLMEEMRAAGAAGAGLSSFGPTVYAVADSGTGEIEAAAKEAMQDVGGEVVITRSRNSGARMRSARTSC
ncbi:MAG TPA: beta-ribofuranosylaminobenzene 5'-phosphate synthase [Methanothrix sp.]|nr:beta-ribofuranosylaminobenzene 5'-phosphate synthase [Methanothrix sp.]